MRMLLFLGALVSQSIAAVLVCKVIDRITRPDGG